ncbi:inositol-1-monophosphatase (plasmid) [Sinorhizobium americanum]|uniref:Inositol-1-monophosphatase n=1 Tax=Sinorhizobium americanum TaxID=194963 RepID=A0A1L3LXC7_9HYPH|nr:inositol-1-monophosphatase [Sinorhizobium americanum]OAP49937.1 hypothetical protein ATC00_09650 [Sinorhizobium americanum]
MDDRQTRSAWRRTDRLPADHHVWSSHQLTTFAQPIEAIAREAGGWYLPFPVDGGRLTKGAPVLAAAPGAVGDLRKLAGI